MSTSILRSRAPRVLVLLLVASFGLVACSSAAKSSSTTSPTTSPTTSSPTRTIVATGSITCSLSGTMTFDPPLRKSGTSPETQTFTLHASSCTTSGSNVSTVTGGSGTATLHIPSNACTSMLSSVPISVTVAWSPSTIASSTVGFSGDSVQSNSAGDVGYVLPGNGGTAAVTGSFAGTDAGAHSSASAFTSTTVVQFLDSCQSSGTSSLSVSGTATLS